MNPGFTLKSSALSQHANLEFGFSRVVVFAGEGHVPLTFGSFWNSFTSFTDVSPAQKFSRNDPGARHSQFDFSYRLPWLRKWVTLYTDSIIHDDASPIDAPRRAAINPGVYLSHFPKMPHLDLRVEAVSTDAPPVTGSLCCGLWHSIGKLFIMTCTRTRAICLAVGSDETPRAAKHGLPNGLSPKERKHRCIFALGLE